jgi:hypothetical protein
VTSTISTTAPATTVPGKTVPPTTLTFTTSLAGQASSSSSAAAWLGMDRLGKWEVVLLWLIIG